ncbi:MAG: ribosomal protein L7/L12 [Pelosinus sp.]|nr:ribosomal protein L7/L12 [Pelosinus sp.]
MDTILWIVLLIVGTFVFALVNKMFNITYFGVKAIFGTWMFCVLATGILGTIFAAFVMTYYKWIIGIAVVLGVLVYMGKKGEKASAVSESNEPAKAIEQSTIAEIKAAVEETAVAPAPVVETVDEGKAEWDVILASAGKRKIEVIAVIREATGLDLAGAKAIVDGAPKVMLNGVEKSAADTIKAKLEAAGASVEVK